MNTSPLHLKNDLDQHHWSKVRGPILRQAVQSGDAETFERILWWMRERAWEARTTQKRKGAGKDSDAVIKNLNDPLLRNNMTYDTWRQMTHILVRNFIWERPPLYGKMELGDLGLFFTLHPWKKRDVLGKKNRKIISTILYDFLGVHPLVCAHILNNLSVKQRKKVFKTCIFYKHSFFRKHETGAFIMFSEYREACLKFFAQEIRKTQRRPLWNKILKKISDVPFFEYSSKDWFIDEYKLRCMDSSSSAMLSLLNDQERDKVFLLYDACPLRDQMPKLGALRKNYRVKHTLEEELKHAGTAKKRKL